MVWLKFAGLSLLIIIFGWGLAKKADFLAEKKQWGKGIVGFVLLGFATSLPELVTTLSSVICVHNASLGAGNILGSNFANFFILFMSLIFAKTMQKKGYIDLESIASLGMFLLILAFYGLAAYFHGNPRPFGISFWGISMIFLFFMSIVVLHKTDSGAEERDQKEREEYRYLWLYTQLAFMLVVLVITSWQISIVVNEIATLTGWDSTAVGALFLAWATSFPELVVTISAVAIGATEMGIGNITGSIIFNMMVLGVADLFAKTGESLFILNNKTTQLILFLMINTAVLLILLTRQTLPRFLKISVWSVIMMVLYAVGMFQLFG
ncbi:hypothetical protein KAH37_06790 [bacterium]|nr:hypothetical protein [bacterium]